MRHPHGLSEEEFIRREKLLQEAGEYFDKGIQVLIATIEDGSKRKMRLFKSGESLAVYAKRKKRWGRYLQDEIGRVVSFKPVQSSVQKYGLDKHLDNLKKFKRIMKKAHPNLWSSLKKGYDNLDLDKYSIHAEAVWAETKDTHALWTLLGEWKRTNDLDLITENRYKTTTIRANPPKRYMRGWAEYEACLRNIQRHLDNREQFHYSWQGNYDVSVSASVGERDGEYRAWLSLEYRGCGNGHYYALINENTAIFLEDD